MPPLSAMDIEQERSKIHEEFIFEASSFQTIPSEILMPYSASSLLTSTHFNEQSPAGDLYRSQLIRMKQRKDQRLERLAKFQADLMGNCISDDDELLQSMRGKFENESDRNESLLDLALRTMLLIHHNQLLQNQITTLKARTKNFVHRKPKVKSAKNSTASNAVRKPTNSITNSQ